MTPVSVIIPAYNEDTAIGDVIVRIRSILGSSEQCEIIVINDGSTDRTGAIASEMGVRVIENPINMGYGFSVKRGIRAATHECLILTDADGTYPIEEVSRLIAEYERGVDMVVGARQGKHYWSSVTKGIARLCFKWMSEFVVGRRIPDINSGFRVIRRSRILPVLPDLSNAFSFTTSGTLIFFLKQYFVTYVPIPYHKRKGSSKVRHLHDALRSMQIMIEIIAAYNPIKLSLLFSLVPFTLFLFFLILQLFSSRTSWVYALLSLYASLMVFALGCLAVNIRKR